MDDFKALLASEFAPIGSLTEYQLDLLEQHYRLLCEWNKRINLTRIRGIREAVQFHYCESLFLAQWLPKDKLRIVDVGSGAGFPGIPVAVLRPDCTVDLIESHQRKAAFLREASRQLPNVNVVSRRAEECTGGYDWMISRAVRVEDLLKLKLAPNRALLMGADDAEGLEVLKVPWGERRVLAFHVEQPNRKDIPDSRYPPRKTSSN
jgi:16S rRNA (guanine(527)-N(7))-methyltransferase RsmG